MSRFIRVVATTTLAALVALQSPNAFVEEARVALDNQRVLVLKTSSTALARHPAAVIVPLAEGAGLGDAYWSGDAARDRSRCPDCPIAIVEPKPREGPPTTLAVEKPRKSAFSGITFKPLFENDRVTVVRGRMETGAQEGWHTHLADIVIVHLSGGTIEDTAEGQTKTNRWSRGDVEFEARGSSHSARNVGPAVEVVLITLKP